MGVSFEFPDPLQPGDCITVIGTVGMKTFSMKFTSNFVAFDPDQLFDERCAAIDKLPVGDTVPLHVIFNTTGEWEVIGSTPETSSNASGFNAVRNGFKPDETFVCKVFVRKENFEVHLNNICLSLSDHMIPVGCIQGVVIEGDCFIHSFFFGDKAAVEKSVRNALTGAKAASKIKNRVSQIKHNLSAAVIECRLKHQDLQSSESLDCSCSSTADQEVDLNNNFQQEMFDDNCNENVFLKRPELQSSSRRRHYHSISDLPSLHRTESYQLVFDVDASDEETDPFQDRSRFSLLDVPTKFSQPVFRAVSCSELLNATAAQQTLPPVLHESRGIASSTLPSQSIQNGVLFDRSPPSAIPIMSLNGVPFLPSESESGFGGTINTFSHNSTDSQIDIPTTTEVLVAKTARNASRYTRLPIPERVFHSKAAFMRRQQTPIRPTRLSSSATSGLIPRFGHPVRPVSFHESMLEKVGSQRSIPMMARNPFAKNFSPTSSLPRETQASPLRRISLVATATDPQNDTSGVSSRGAVRDGALPGRSCPQEVQHLSNTVKDNELTNQLKVITEEQLTVKRNGTSPNVSAPVRWPKNTTPNEYGSVGTSTMMSLTKPISLRRRSSSENQNSIRKPAHMVPADRPKDTMHSVKSNITLDSPLQISSRKIGLPNHDSIKLMI